LLLLLLLQLAVLFMVSRRFIMAWLLGGGSTLRHDLAQ